MIEKPNLKRQAIVARSRARRALMQLLYQWQISDSSASDTYRNQIEQQKHYEIDEDYFNQAWEYITENSKEIDESLTPFLNRPVKYLDPVEHAILWVGSYELTQRNDIHHNVIINEAIELCKQFGGDDSYKFINGVLDKLRKDCRAD